MFCFGLFLVNCSTASATRHRISALCLSENAGAGPEQELRRLKVKTLRQKLQVVYNISQ